jgi:hypothetical protein
MTLHIRLVASLILAIAVAACASRQDRPVAQNICINAPQQNEAEAKFIKRRINAYLQEYNFTPASDHCDVTLDYQPMGAFQGESIQTGLFFTSRNGYWSQEGMYTLKMSASELKRDEPVNLRGYATKQDLLDNLAWILVEPITRWFRAPKATTPLHGEASALK